jgi:superfamily I DNA/RNA helicase
VYNTLDELPIDVDSTWYFLSRNNWFLQGYADMLRKRARVFTVKDLPSFDTKQLDAIAAFENARKRGKMTEVEEVKLKLHLKGAPDLSRPWFDNVNFPNDTIAYYRDLIRTKAHLSDTKLHVNTIHGVKGGEADNVVLMLDFTKAVRNNIERNPDAELRCLYVALTRAKKNLHIVHSSSRNGYDNYWRLDA